MRLSSILERTENIGLSCYCGCWLRNWILDLKDGKSTHFHFETSSSRSTRISGKVAVYVALESWTVKLLIR
eukprot:m.155668 g.155668  ORF g.155668 m.155668 type:complete len:71 (+) comp16423_c0_seq1:2270-2482(+)